MKKEESFIILTKAELMRALGGADFNSARSNKDNRDAGGSCAAINSSGVVQTGLSSGSAQSWGSGGHWCCDSCGSATWL